MLLAPLLALVPQASSDPIDTGNEDYTRTVTWDMDAPGDYAVSGMVVAGGEASLSLVNESVTENTPGDYAAGTSVNLDSTSFPDMMILDETSTFTTTLEILQDEVVGVDAHIYEDRATDNYGLEKELRIDSETNRVYRILMRFNLTDIPTGACLNDATLRLYQNPGGKGNEIDYGIHSLDRPFEELETNWVKSTTSQFWTAPGGDYSAAPYSTGTLNNSAGWKAFDITNLVECWVGGALANNGLIFVPQEAVSDSAKDFISSDDDTWPTYRPLLVVNYTMQGNEGAYESAALGPGTNANFTTVDWSNGTVSLLSDEFSQSPLSSKWTWQNNPLADGGSYNVGVTLPGWLNVLGSPNTQNLDRSIDSNYLYQEVTDDFAATIRLRDYFTVDHMEAGLLMVENDGSWFSMAKADADANGKIAVVLCQDGESSTVAAVPWVDVTYTHLRIVRNSTGFWLSASTDGQGWTDVYHHAPPAAMAQKMMIGIYLSSNSAAQPTAQFDFLRIDPLDEPTFQVMVRTGDSASTSDPSWTDWTSPLLEKGASLGMTGKYIRYRAYFSTAFEWYTPSFSGLTVHWERYSPTGQIETEDYDPEGFGAWLSFAADHDDAAGAIEYSFSTDGGDSWNFITSGSSAPLAALDSAIRIRANVSTQDTFATPTIDSLRLTYGTALSTFYIETPSEVVVGDTFPVEIWARNEDNKTTTQLTGAISLRAMDQTGMNEASDELAVTSWLISSAGHALIPTQRYFAAETITIEVSKDDVSGLSAPITMLPGPIMAIDMLPEDDTIIEDTTMTLEGVAMDQYGNVVPGAEFSWTITAGLGDLSSATGPSVVFYPGEGHSTGYINVTSNGLTASRYFTVECIGHPPVFSNPVPDQTAVEDGPTWTYDLEPLIYDARDDIEDLRWFVTGENLVTASNENATGHMLLTLTPKPDCFGHDVLNLFVVDPEGGSAQTQVVVDIGPVNDAPTISEVNPLVVDHGDAYYYKLMYYIEDVDNDYDELSLSVDQASSEYVTVLDDTLSLKFEYPEELVNTIHVVVVTVTDGELSSSTPISVTVLDDNVPELISSMPSVVIHQGEALINLFDLDDYFFDPDEDVLYYVSGETHVVIDIVEGNLVNFYAPTDWAGEEYAVFSAVDPMGARMEDAVKVTVLPVNQAPWITGLPDIQVRYDLRFELDTARYIGDGDDDIDSLALTTDDPHVSVIGTVLSFMYPQDMEGMSVEVNVTVSDEEFTDRWAINVTISDNTPPESLGPPDHSFPEDWPQDYADASGLGLAEWFEDVEDGDELEYEVFSWSDNVTAELMEDGAGEWIVTFSPDANYFGETKLTIRATDTDGALVEDTIAVTITSSPDAPVFNISNEFTVIMGADTTYDLRQYITDVDSELSQLNILVPAAYREYITGTSTLVMIRFPDGYLSSDERSKAIMVELRVVDQDGLHDSSMMHITVTSPASNASLSSLSMLLLLLAGGISLGLFGMVLSMRKKPFVIKDMMLVHEDGFLINRHIEADEVDMDKDIFTGMLTAVLNFVEDSMSSTQEQLKFFGFEHYRVMVGRGKKIYAAIVFEGDRAKGIEDHIAKFLAKVEKVYRKSLENWTGDIEVDFAGIELLIKAFVGEHSKKGKHRNGDSNGRLRANDRADSEDGQAPEEILVDASADDAAATVSSESR